MQAHKYGNSTASYSCAEARVQRKHMREQREQGDHVYKSFSCKHAQRQTNKAVRRHAKTHIRDKLLSW